MGWQNILKRRNAGVSNRDINTVNYIMRDGNFRTADAIMDEIYELIQENKKLGHKLMRIKERPKILRQIGVSKQVIQSYMTKSPEFESRDTGNKTLVKTPIIEYRYIGV